MPAAYRAGSQWCFAPLAAERSVPTGTVLRTSLHHIAFGNDGAGEVLEIVKRAIKMILESSCLRPNGLAGQWDDAQNRTGLLTRSTSHSPEWIFYNDHAQVLTKLIRRDCSMRVLHSIAHLCSAKD